MKKLFLFVFLLLLLINTKIYSQDTSIVKYLPLQVGNVWVYNRTQSPFFPPGPGKDLVKAESSFIANNHIYFVLKTYIYYDSGQMRDTVSKYVRIDSLSCNIFEKLVSGECLDDSLKSHKFDSSYSSCIGRTMKCIDTNIYSLFSQSPKSKTFDFLMGEAGLTRTYAKNFGMVYNREVMAAAHIIYRSLKGCIINGVLYGDTSTITGIHQINTEISNNFSLSQNYPNPFNPGTNIKFQIANLSNVKLVIYDALGKEVTTLVNEQLKPGTYEAEFDGTNLPCSVYYYKLETADYSETKKMVLIK